MSKLGSAIALIQALKMGPTDAQVTDAVDDWLDDHPEATTTVTDGSITNAKLASSFVTPGTAAAYSSSSTYAVGDYVFYGGALYRCTTAITTAEAWTSAHWTAVTLGADVEETKQQIKNIGIEQSASGNPIVLKDSATAELISLTAGGDCDVVIAGKNLLSPDFSVVAAYADRADETVIYGKGAYDYCFGSRVTVSKCGDNTITLTPISANVLTTGVGICVKVKPSTKYTLSYLADGPGTASVMFYGSDKAYLSNAKESAVSGYSFTTTAATEYVIIAFRGTTNGSEVTFTNMQLEEGETATGFVLYQNKMSASVVSGKANVNGIFSYYPLTNIYSADDVTISVSYFANGKSYAEENNKKLIDDLQENAFVSSYNTLDGWEDHAKAFSQMMYDVTDTEGFMFFTDTHFMAKQTESEWKKYAYAIFAYMEQLYYASPCSFVLHGGDWLGTGEGWGTIIYKLSTLSGIFKSKFNRFALLVGNHETGNQSSDNHTTTHGTLAATLLSNVGKTYYRFDANTFHLYCFDSWVSGAIDSYAKEQIAWFANSLLSETAAHIAIAIHILYDSGTLKGIGDELTKCASAYNSRTSYTYDGHTYNFSSCTGKVAFVIAGHEHGDSSGTVNSIPYILTTNTTGYSETSFASLPLPVDLVKVDWNTGKLTAYRAARGSVGSTRELSIIV